MFNKNHNKGFTIIELLVVFVLIAILFGIIFASFDNAKKEGMEDTIDSYFMTLKTQSQRYYNKYDKFYSKEEGAESICYDKTLGFGGYSGYLEKIEDLSGASEIELGNEISGDWNTVTCHVMSSSDGSIDKWVVEAPTPDSTSDSPEMYCIDNTMGIVVKMSGVLMSGENQSSGVGYSCTDRQSNSD